MQTKYDINAPDFMSREHVFYVSSNKIFGFKSWRFFFKISNTITMSLTMRSAF